MNAKAQISEVLEENLEVARQTLKIFDEYRFILKEKERIRPLLARNLDRESLQVELDDLQS